MAIVLVTDDRGRPLENWEVIIGWQGGGTSRERTNSSGQADFGNYEATATYISVEGKRFSGRWMGRSDEVHIKISR